MKLQILIPQYKETEDIIKPLLDSIEVQQNVNLKVISPISSLLLESPCICVSIISITFL